ncbi:MAG: penicillin acylase family protein, partial [Acidobacteria bacterium]|nr:penicillin acylase family protein [Acidobacteriota bacterium]
RRYNGGRLAAVLGPEAVEHDRLLRLIQYQGPWDDAEFNSYHPQGRRIFTAFANGVNAYIESHRDNLPVEFKLTGITPEPWTLQDLVLRVPARSLASARAELRFALSVARLGPAEATRRAQPDPFIEAVVPRGLDLSIISQDVLDALDGTLPAVPFPRPPLLERFRRAAGAVPSLDFGAPEDSPGSNNWVVSGRHTATGAVLLANDPHRQVTNPSLRYLVHLNAPGWDVIGATEPAIPGVAIGHNGRIGWGLTIVGTDYDDVFVEELNPASPNQAKWQGEWYPLRVVVDTIEVRGEAPRTVERKYSRHGPIFYEDPLNHRAYALRSTLQEAGTAEYLGALRLNQASLAPDCGAFLEQQRYYLAPSENMICGDVEGNIAWHASALTPNRVGGWYGRLPVPGTGEYSWNGYRDDLPYEYNPERGWIATANHNVLPHGYYPPLFFKRAPYVRWDRLNQIFGSAGHFRVEDFERLQHDTRWPYIDAEKALLRGWTSSTSDVEWARTEILAWDGRYESDSVAASLHNYWRRNLDDETLRPDGWPARGGVGSSGFRLASRKVSSAQEDQARTALEQGTRQLREALGAERASWRWGRLHASQFPHWLVSAYDLPGVERSGGGGTVAATGATFREVIDFSNLDNSRVTSTPGQSGQPGSPFYGNLRELWGNGRYFPLVYSRAAVEAASAHRLILRPLK